MTGCPFRGNVAENIGDLSIILRINNDNCDNGKFKTGTVSHAVLKTGVAVDPRKVETIASWLVPKSLKALSGFLCLTL